MDRENSENDESHGHSDATNGNAAPRQDLPKIQEPEGSPIDIPVVGIGGSAGSLAPLEAFFASMPRVNCGAAFVVIQHMLPTHESFLPYILARHTIMPIVQAQDGIRVRPDCVYVIPPSQHLSFRNGTLVFATSVTETRIQLPMDHFFRSLAEDRAERAICILFSGAGSDGTLGAQAIRVAGGLVIAQDPGTAQFLEMPRSAIMAGVVDYVLPPERMPEAVIQYLRHPYADSRKRAADIEAAVRPGDIQEILSIVLAQTGFDFRGYKTATVLRRIGRRMGLRQISQIAEYSRLLQRDAAEVKQLLKDFLIKVTAFFRDPEAFEELRDRAIVPLIDEKQNDETFRVWVTGCATGEEAYSLAILLIEQLEKVGKNCPLQLYATDVDEEALASARRGLYPECIAGDVSPERLARFFVHGDDGYRVIDALRKTVMFASQNLLSDTPFSKMDLISCRNLLIYLNTESQTKLTTLFNFALRPGGYLFLGRSESVVGQSDLFETISSTGRLSRRLASVRPLVLDSPLLPMKLRLPSAGAGSYRQMRSNFADEIRLEMLKHFGASVILIDRKGQILQFHGQTDKYLNLPAAGPTFNVFDLAKDRLSTKLRLAIHKSFQDNTKVVLDAVPIVSEEATSYARVTVVPVPQKGEREPLLVVFFEDVHLEPAIETDWGTTPESETLVQHLEAELRVTQQDLQSSIAELQSANEDLRAANEEVNSANEELHSTIEQLVTSSEELQSANEELNTVNSQLQEKILQLDAVNSDMTNLLLSSQVATLFLDGGLRIKFFTPAIAGILNVVPSDMGRPLVELPMNFGDYDLAADALAVARNGSRIETEVHHKDGASYLLQVMPYYTQERRPDGVIATFSDITRLRRAEKKLAVIVESSSDAIFSKTSEGVILTWNTAASKMYGYSTEEVIGKNVSILTPSDRVIELGEIMERIRSGNIVSSFETERLTKDGRVLHVSLTISPIRDPSGRITGASTIARDITEQWRAREALRESEERFRTLVESSPNAVLLTDADGTITLLNKRALVTFGYRSEELLGKSVEMLVPARFRKHHPLYRARFAAAPLQRPMGAGRDLIALRKDGMEIPVEIGLTPLEMPEGTVTMATITDITGRKRQEGSG